MSYWSCPTKEHGWCRAGDEQLEIETKEEMKKYQIWKMCGIWNSCSSYDKTVQMLLEFERVKAKIKAVVDLNWRHFGG
jgi:hypothetical protein